MQEFQDEWAMSLIAIRKEMEFKFERMFNGYGREELQTSEEIDTYCNDYWISEEEFMKKCQEWRFELEFKKIEVCHQLKEKHGCSKTLYENKRLEYCESRIQYNSNEAVDTSKWDELVNEINKYYEQIKWNSIIEYCKVAKRYEEQLKILELLKNTEKNGNVGSLDRAEMNKLKTLAKKYGNGVYDLENNSKELKRLKVDVKSSIEAQLKQEQAIDEKGKQNRAYCR